MTTITLKINEKTKAGKILTAMIELFSKEKKGVEIVDNKSKAGIDVALEDIKKGRTKSYENSETLFKEVLNV
jgi:hypothetical protein